MDAIFSPAKLQGTAAVPSSKSETHRRLICAALTPGETVLERCSPSADMWATARCIETLGADFRLEGDRAVIRGMAHKPDLMPLLDCGESGSTLRFFVPIAMALTHGGIFRMHGRLSQRPMEVYRELFVPRGVMWRMREGVDSAAELTVAGTIGAGSFLLPGNVSSQFVSGLLFALPLLESDSELTVTPPVESASYIAMTVRALQESGIDIRQTGEGSWSIPGRQRYAARSGALHGDWSQAAALLCMDALGHDILVEGVSTDTIQGDAAVMDFLRTLGAEIIEEEGGIRAVAKDRLHGAVLDMRNTPDIAPMLALVCQMAEGESRLTHCGRLRLKECDRLACTADTLSALGGCCRVEGDDLVISGVTRLRGGVTLDSQRDHRMVMLMSAAALGADQPITVRGVESLGKSWPEFLDVYRSLGGKTE